MWKFSLGSQCSSSRPWDEPVQPLRRELPRTCVPGGRGDEREGRQLVGERFELIQVQLGKRNFFSIKRIDQRHKCSLHVGSDDQHREVNDHDDGHDGREHREHSELRHGRLHRDLPSSSEGNLFELRNITILPSLIRRGRRIVRLVSTRNSPSPRARRASP